VKVECRLDKLQYQVDNTEVSFIYFKFLSFIYGETPSGSNFLLHQTFKFLQSLPSHGKCRILDDLEQACPIGGYGNAWLAEVVQAILAEGSDEPSMPRYSKNNRGCRVVRLMASPPT
jgi:hypothetical protein